MTPLSSVVGISSLQLVLLKFSVLSTYFSKKIFKCSTSAFERGENQIRGEEYDTLSVCLKQKKYFKNYDSVEVCCTLCLFSSQD